MPPCTAADGREMVKEYPTEIEAGMALNALARAKCWRGYKDFSERRAD